MTENTLNVFQAIDAQIADPEYRISDGACIQHKDAITDELLENVAALLATFSKLFQ